MKVLEMLQRRARQFRPRKEIWPLRVPREPILLDDVIEEALPEDDRAFDPMTLRSRALLSLRWDDGSENRLLASGKRDAEAVDTDRLFLERLAESAGEDFGIETAGTAPSRVRSSLSDRAFLVDVFVSLFEVAGTEESVRRELAAGGRGQLEPQSGGADFRADVEQWLADKLVN